jgi:hypothetical protein
MWETGQARGEQQEQIPSPTKYKVVSSIKDIIKSDVLLLLDEGNK